MWPFYKKENDPNFIKARVAELNAKKGWFDVVDCYKAYRRLGVKTMGVHALYEIMEPPAACRLKLATMPAENIRRQFTAQNPGYRVAEIHDGYKKEPYLFINWTAFDWTKFD